MLLQFRACFAQRLHRRAGERASEHVFEPRRENVRGLNPRFFWVFKMSAQQWRTFRIRSRFEDSILPTKTKILASTANGQHT
jgi:hypothetical protein